MCNLIVQIHQEEYATVIPENRHKSKHNRVKAIAASLPPVANN